MIISVRDLAVRYDRATAIEKVSFDINEGDFFAIVGENGSGKSTLMKAILGIVRPVSGEVHFNGITRKEIGYLPQQTIVQKDFPASVYEIVLSGFTGKNGFSVFHTKKEKTAALANMELMEISSLKRLSYRDLSPGQQQRVLIARALAAAKKVLMLDEPVAGLDPNISSELYRLLNTLNSQKVTIVMISHDLNATVKFASHILHLSKYPLFLGKCADFIRSNFYKTFSENNNND
jgi:zinc transport system ATP-binding protein